MVRKYVLWMMWVVAMVWTISGIVYAQGPDFFTAAIYADGEAWATKGLGTLPPANDHNRQSFDQLFVFTNGADGQLPVAEASPGNPLYNGGRWNLQLATWMTATPPVVMSFDEIEGYIADGYILISSGNSFFECPLLPLKKQ